MLISNTKATMLQNEKYRGSALLQKCFTTDFLTKKRKVNEGEVPQYYIENSHEAIIDPLEWDAVQDEVKRRKAIGRAYSSKSIFGAKLKCGDCGGWFGVKTWHSTDRYRTSIWQCNCKFDKGKDRCKTPHLTEEEIEARFIAAYNSMLTDKSAYLLGCETAREFLMDTTALDTEMEELLRELDVIAGLIRKCIDENSATAQDQTEYTSRYNAYVDRYEKAKARYDSLAANRQDKLAGAKAVERFMAVLDERDDPLTEFDRHLWIMTVDYATVHRDGTITFRFYDGTEITK